MNEEERRRIYGFEFKFIFREFFLEGAAFFFLCFYYFIEYTRLQTIYPVLNIVPWGFLSALLAVMFMPGDKLREHPKYLLVFAVYGFILLTFISMIYALDSKTASERGYIFLNWLIVFFITISLVTTERRFVFFLLLFFLWNFKMSQHGAYSWAVRGFSFAKWGIGGPQGWFENSGEYGLQMAMVCIISFCYFLGAKKYLSKWRRLLFLALPITSFMTVLASSSRGDYLALAAAFVWLGLAVNGRRLAYSTLVIVVLCIGYWAMPTKMMERFSVAGNKDDYTSYTRETRWKAGYKIFIDNPIIGVGTGSWVAYYERHFPRERGREGWGLPHNSFIEVIGNHGIFGVLFILLIFGGMFSLNKSTRKTAIKYDDPIASWLSRGFDAATVAYIIGGSFMSVFHYPYIWVQSAMIIALNVATRKKSLELSRLKSSEHV